MQDLSRNFDLHHSSQQSRMLNPLSEARDRTHNLMVPSQICFHCAMTGTPNICSLVIRLFGGTNEIIYVKALYATKSLYVYIRHYVLTLMKNAEHGYFTLQKNMQVPTILDTKIYKGKK